MSDATHSLLHALALHEFFRGTMDLDLGTRCARSALTMGLGTLARVQVVARGDEEMVAAAWQRLLKEEDGRRSVQLLVRNGLRHGRGGLYNGLPPSLHL